MWGCVWRCGRWVWWLKETLAHCDTHQHQACFPPQLLLVTAQKANSPIPLRLAGSLFFCFFFKHQQDAGKSKVKTRFMFELSKYFQLNRSWLLVEQHNASLCRCQNWCFSVWCHDLNLQIKTDNMFCHGAIFRACGEKKSLHTERRNPAEDSFLFLLVDCS